MIMRIIDFYYDIIYCRYERAALPLATKPEALWAFRSIVFVVAVKTENDDGFTETGRRHNCL